jgi:hypothetical protein
MVGVGGEGALQGRDQGQTPLRFYLSVSPSPSLSLPLPLSLTQTETDRERERERERGREGERERLTQTQTQHFTLEIVDLANGEVGGGVGANDRGCHAAAVGEGDLDALRGAHDMCIR